MATYSARNAIAHLITYLGLTEVPIEPDGSCGLLFDQDTHVTLEPDIERTDLLHLHTLVGSIAAGNRKAQFVHLLRGNYLGRASGGAVLSLDATETSILLHTSLITEPMNLESLSEHLMTLVQSAKLWQQRLANAEATKSRSDTPTDLSFSSMLRV
ncbi:hypothetical protein GCM10023213_47650 [Prosthecobacter algae]|uniref:Tir chaperone family protein CesT n=1 Tax=Prosthecobacter algae TaxID=1144682 RepID=A0ABP9PNM2_9BACT